jgi:hypothetical protein
MRFEAECSESLTISQMRQLWEVEQILNGLPANLRVHIEISETALGRLDIKKEE